MKSSLANWILKTSLSETLKRNHHRIFYFNPKTKITIGDAALQPVSSTFSSATQALVGPNQIQALKSAITTLETRKLLSHAFARKKSRRSF